MRTFVSFLASHPFETRLAVHGAALYLFMWATGDLYKPGRPTHTAAGKLVRGVINGWFIIASCCLITEFYRGPWGFWFVVFVVDYLLVAAAVAVRRLGLLDEDLAPTRTPPTE